MISMSDLMPEPTAEELEEMFNGPREMSELERLWDAMKQRIIIEAIRNGRVVTQGEV